MTEDRAPGPRAAVPVRRLAMIPDPVRVERYRLAPELGPRVLFFSGGNALRTLSRRLVEYTHNSIHVVTPFDSGGSSAALRAAFDMPAVGDLRNRLMALADQSVRGNPEVYDLFTYRFPEGDPPDALRARLDRMIDGSDPLVLPVPAPQQSIVRRYLASFREAMPRGFDLRRAAVGNLVLTAGYLDEGRNLNAALYLFSRLVEARGTVRPVVDADLHLVAEYADGTRLAGQHLITEPGAARARPPVEALYLSRSMSEPSPYRPVIDASVRALVEGADLICYPVGSFYSSVLATLLPLGMADAVAQALVPKVYVPNPRGTDPEEAALDLLGKVRKLVRHVVDGASTSVPPSSVLDVVLLDARAEPPSRRFVEEASKHGLEIVRTPLSTTRTAPLFDDHLFAEALLSLA